MQRQLSRPLRPATGLVTSLAPRHKALKGGGRIGECNGAQLCTVQGPQSYRHRCGAVRTLNRMAPCGRRGGHTRRSHALQERCGHGGAGATFHRARWPRCTVGAWSQYTIHCPLRNDPAHEPAACNRAHVQLVQVQKPRQAIQHAGAAAARSLHTHPMSCGAPVLRQHDSAPTTTSLLSL